MPTRHSRSSPSLALPSSLSLPFSLSALSPSRHALFPSLYPLAPSLSTSLSLYFSLSLFLSSPGLLPSSFPFIERRSFSLPVQERSMRQGFLSFTGRGEKGREEVEGRGERVEESRGEVYQSRSRGYCSKCVHYARRHGRTSIDYKLNVQTLEEE